MRHTCTKIIHNSLAKGQLNKVGAGQGGLGKYGSESSGRERVRACGRATACDRKRVENAQGRQLQTHVRTTSDVSTTTTIPPIPFLAEFTDLSASQHMRRWYTSESCPAPRSRPCSVPILDSVFSSPPSTQGGSHRKRCAFSSRIIPQHEIYCSKE